MDYRCDEFASISLLGRFVSALSCLERYLARHHLTGIAYEDLLGYLWEVPTTRDLGAWEGGDRPALFEVAMGDDFPAELRQEAVSRGLDLKLHRAWLENVVEIIMGSMYAATDDKGSLRHLGVVFELAKAEGISPPPVSAFSHQRLSERGGWGSQVSAAQRDAWRAGRWGAA